MQPEEDLRWDHGVPPADAGSLRDRDRLSQRSRVRAGLEGDAEESMPDALDDGHLYAVAVRVDGLGLRRQVQRRDDVRGVREAVPPGSSIGSGDVAVLMGRLLRNAGEELLRLLAGRVPGSIGVRRE